MSIDDDIALLERVPLLRLLGRQALRVMAIGADQRDIMRGDFLFSEGEGSEGGYVVQRGNFKISSSDDEVRAVFAGPGMLIGESALIVDTPCRTSAEAVEDSSVIRITRTLFHKVLESDPDAAMRLRDALAARSNSATSEIIAVRRKLSPR